jgi:hypothetical protein
MLRSPDHPQCAETRFSRRPQSSLALSLPFLSFHQSPISPSQHHTIHCFGSSSLDSDTFSELCNLSLSPSLPRQFAGSPTGLPGSGGLRPHQTAIMAEEIVIDKTTFFSRLSNLYSTWKTDKRTGNALFDGAGSIVILMGKTDEENSFQKSNAMHVSHRISGRGVRCWHLPDC